MKLKANKRFSFIEIMAIVSIVAAILVPLFLAIAPQIIAKITNDPMSLIIGLLGCLICFSIFLALEQVKLFHSLRDQEEHHKTIRESIIPKQFHSFFNGNDEINNEIVKRVLPKYIKNFDCSNNTLSVQGSIWAIECYNEFWDCLINSQKKNPERLIDVFAVDVSYAKIQIDTQFSKEVDFAIECQKQFLKNNGKIKRVFFGIEEYPDKELIKLFEDMLKEDNYEAYYLSKSNYNFNEREDFLIIPDQYSCHWHYDLGAMTPNRVTIKPNADFIIKREWENIYAVARKQGLDLKKG
jgi:hypothetical protein